MSDTTNPRHRATITVLAAHFTDGTRQGFSTTRDVHIYTETPGLIQVRHHNTGPLGRYTETLAVIPTHGLKWLSMTRSPEVTR